MGKTENITERKNLSALDEYINKVYVLVLLLVPGACQCAGLIYTLEKIIGWLPSVSWPLLIIFDITCLIYLSIGIIFVRTGFEDGLVSRSKLKAGKIFLTVIMFIQFNFILYMIPATDFWGFAFFFVILTTFFLDYKMVIVTSIEIAGSLVVVWLFYGKVHLPLQDEYFMANMLDRIVCVVLSMLTTVLLTYLVQRFLVNAKKDEMKRNNERVQSVLTAVAELSDHLSAAGSTLSEISDRESTSARELASTSETLLASSNALEQKTDESRENLDELKKWADVVNTNVEKVENTSKNLLDKSKNNEQLLLSLQTINTEVSQSMDDTNEVAIKLSEAVKKIDVALKLVSDISSSINLLALNASIEAARAGEAGRGFSVVADEVGKLANSTKESLDEVKSVIDLVQDNVGEMAQYVEENLNKLTKQNEYFNNVFSGIQEMMQMLHCSIDDISTMGNAYDQQTEVIRSTISISEDIAENIRQENHEFSNINEMVDNNANDIEAMAKQITMINSMVEEMNKLLNQ